MKTIKLFAWFFGTFFGAMLTLSLCLALVTWTPVYDVIHSAWSVFTVIISFCTGLGIIAELEDSIS
jgi:hypothetical protein